MPTIPKHQTDLARMLGIAKSAVSAQVRRGMPTTSLEAAQAWRREHIDPARKKGSRLDRYYRPRQQLPAPETDALAQVITLMATASDALTRGQGIEAMVPALRGALAAVPPELRDDFGTLPMPVMRVLLRHVLDVLPARESNPTDEAGNPFYIDGTTLSDEDAKAAGAIWYEIAAGELVFDLDALREYYKRTAP